MIWLVVADGAKARIFDTNVAGEPFEEVETLENERGRDTNTEMNRDRPGRVSSGGGQRSAYDEGDKRDIVEAQFAADVADYLEKHRQQNDYEQLVILAAPKFLGQLRGEFSTGVENAVRFDKTVNLTKASRGELQSRFQKLDI